MIRAILTVLALLSLPAAAQEARARFGADGAPAIRLRSTTDISILAPTLQAFVARNPGLAVNYEQWGSNDLYALGLAECEAGQTGADALFSSAVHQMVELVNFGCASPYWSEATLALPEARRWRDEIWGITHEAAVIVYNRALLPPEDVPQTRFDLLDLMRRDESRHRGRIATYDIEASGLGYLFAYADSLEASTFGALLEGFARADAVATCCSAEIIQGVAEGRYLLAYNVLGSYVEANRGDSVGVVRPRDYTLFLSRAYMIPKGASPEAARLLDFLLSAEGQKRLSDSGLAGTGRDPDASGLPESAERPIPISPELLVARDAQKRGRFIARWRDTFGRAAMP